MYVWILSYILYLIFYSPNITKDFVFCFVSKKKTTVVRLNSMFDLNELTVIFLYKCLKKETQFFALYVTALHSFDL